MKFFHFLTLAIVSLLTMTSCWIETSPPEGLARHTSKLFRFDIDYPLDSSSATLKEKDGFHLLTILDNDDSYRIQLLALKTDDDNRYKFDFYPTIDTLYYKRGVFQTEKKNFFSDRIIRTYSINEYITMETISIFGGDRVYVIYSEFNEEGRSRAHEITKSFRTSSGIGPVNFCKRKLYSLFGDNKVTVFLSYILFSIIGTLLFWIGVAKCFDMDSPVGVTMAIILFVVVFAFIFTNDDFVGYFYGHNNLGHLVAALATLFGQDG